MLITAICIIFILYYLKTLLYTDLFMTMMDRGFTLMDAVMLVSTIIWFVLQTFFESGPVVLFVSLFIIAIDRHYENDLRLRMITLKAQIITIILINLFIGINHLHFKLSLWKLIMEI